MKNKANLLVIILTFLFVGCVNSKSKTINGIDIPVQVLVVSSQHGFNYEDTLKSALNGNDYSMKRLSTIDFFDTSIGYEHGAILIEIINKIGEEQYLIAINDCSEKEKSIIRGDLMAGMEYGQHHDKTMSEMFPKIAVYFNIP